MSEEIVFAPSRSDEETLRKYVGLFEQCFPGSKIADVAYLDWLYRQNPDGEVVGFDALVDETPVATYVCVPLTLSLEGRNVKALLALNSATAPAYQRRGLYTRLATMTYESAAQAGFVAVVGVANQNVIGGLTRNLRFQDVGGLDARIGFAPTAARDRQAETSAALRRVWTAECLAWRIANPLNSLRVFRASDGGVLVEGATQYPVIAVRARIHTDAIAPTSAHRNSWPPLSLSLNLVPKGAATPNWSLPIPEFLKPSPLRFIFRSLRDPGKRIDPKTVFWTFLDFDAY